MTSKQFVVHWWCTAEIWVGTSSGDCRPISGNEVLRIVP